MKHLKKKRHLEYVVIEKGFHRISEFITFLQPLRYSFLFPVFRRPFVAEETYKFKDNSSILTPKFLIYNETFPGRTETMNSLWTVSRYNHNLINVSR